MSANVDDWIRDGMPFAGEVDLEHPWATEHRLPIVTTWWPRWKYEVALVIPTAADPHPPLWPVEWPTEDEARLIGWFIGVRMDYYNDGWRAQMRRRPLDVDSSTNTVMLGKIDGCWHYRRLTWRDGAPFWPGLYKPPAGPFPGFDGLLELIREHAYQRSPERWAEHAPPPPPPPTERTDP